MNQLITQTGIPSDHLTTLLVIAGLGLLSYLLNCWLDRKF